MGDCKAQLSPKTTASKSNLGIFKRKNKAEDPKNPDTFADLIGKADSQLAEMLAVKERDLSSEKGQEVENRRSLSILRSMEFHLNQIAELGASYLEGK